MTLKGKGFFSQTKKWTREGNEPSKGQCERKMAALDDILIWYTQKGKKEITAHKQRTHAKKVMERDQPPDDELELRFLFLSHVKGLIRGSAPVRIRVSMDKVDALLAFVRASAGLSLPESKTTFCKV